MSEIQECYWLLPLLEQNNPENGLQLLRRVPKYYGNQPTALLDSLIYYPLR